MVDSLRFKDLSGKQLETLQGVVDANECKDLLQNYLGLGDRSADKVAGVVVDFHFYNLAFCRNVGFSPAKVSTFCSIMKELLLHDGDAVQRRCETSFDDLKALILKHSVWRPPRSDGVFSKEDVQRIAEFVTNSYYRHFSLYRAVLAKRAQLILEQTPLGQVDVPKAPVPLDEGVEVVGGIDDVALTDEENELINRVVAKKMAKTVGDYEMKKTSLTEQLKALEPEPEPVETE